MFTSNTGATDAMQLAHSRSLGATLLLALVLAAPLAAQTIAIGDTLTVIQRPLLNIPAIVTPGQVLEINCVADPATTGWAADLRRGSLQIPLPVQTAAYDASTTWWTVTVTVPDVPVFDLYDLHVSADGGIDDTTRHAVKVVQALRDDFYWIHVTDTHLPTSLYYTQTGADTDSSEAEDFRAVIEDINLINPEFVLHTGDLVNEGELEDFLSKRYYTRAQHELAELQVPVYLTSGNHDIGGWDSTPPPDGTARRDWWRFFGWKRLDSPPPGAPDHSQDYSFDYGPVHFIGLEAYDNYDSWRYDIYGAESLTDEQLQWLDQDIASAAGSSARVLFFHYDFGGQIDAARLGLDMVLYGHIHYSRVDEWGGPYVLSTGNTGDEDREYRMIRWRNGQLEPLEPFSAGTNGQNLTVSYSPANDGTHDSVTATISNSLGEEFENGLLRILMPSGAAGYTATGGTLTQVDDVNDPAVCYVNVVIPANGTVTVTVEVDTTAATGAGDLPGTPRLRGVSPNPFNPRTEIAFDLPAASACRVRVFDLQGRTVATLVDGELAAGRHTVVWQGVDDRGDPQPSGLYLVRLTTPGYSETRKMTLAR